MQISNGRIFTMMGLFALFLVSIIVSQYYNALNKAELQKKRKAEYGSLHFSGKVMASKVYRYMNKNYYKICVRLDSSNAVRPTEIYNDDDALRIGNGIAAFSAGYLNHILGPADSVAVNMNNSSKVIFYYEGGVSDSRSFAFEPMGLSKNDLNGCN